MAAAWLRLVLALILANGQQLAANKKQQQLWLDCSCLHANERNGTQWGSLSINASHALGAKNNCLMIFIGGTADELVAFQLRQLQLRPGACRIQIDQRSGYVGHTGSCAAAIKTASAAGHRPSVIEEVCDPNAM